MGPLLFRIALIAAGLGFGQIGLDSFARGDPGALFQFGFALVLLVAGSAGFVVPLLAGSHYEEVSPHV